MPLFFPFFLFSENSASLHLELLKVNYKFNDYHLYWKLSPFQMVLKLPDDSSYHWEIVYFL